MRRPILLAFTALASIAACADAASAQDAQPKATQPARRPAAPQPAKSAGLEEIVVTAQKRTNTAQKTAASIEVVGAATLARQNIVQLQDLNAVLPSVQLLPFVNSVQIDIRGVESNFIDPRADPAVAVSVNGLFFDRPLPTGFAFLDVARVEDLNGPQGTLYGRNAVGGALNIITNKPTNQFGGSITAEGGDYGENNFTGILNVPLSDTLAVRAAYQRDRRDGYLGNYYDDENTDAARLSARWVPNDRLTVYVEGDFVHQGGHGTVQESYPCTGSRPWSLDVPGTSFYIPGVTRPVGCTDFGGGKIATNASTDSYVQAYQGQIDYSFDWFTVTSITGFVDTHQQWDNLPNATINLNSTRANNYDYSEEIRIAGHDQATHAGGFAWQVGAFFFDSTGDFLQTTRLAYDNPILRQFIGAPSTVIYSGLPQDSEAGFVQATYGVTDRLRVTGGVRYTNDFKGVEQPGLDKLQQTEDHFTYKGGLEYDLSPRNLLYGSVSSGYLAGGPDGGSPSLPTSADRAPVFFQPETITAYEIGLKNRFFNNRLQLNGDVYYYKFHDLQITEPGTYNTEAGGSTLVVENAGGLKTYGFELSSQLAVTPADHFSASVTVARGFYDGAVFPETPAGVPTTTDIPAGQRLVNLPLVTALLGYEHVWNIDDDKTLTASINTKISSSYPLEFGTPIIPEFDTQRSYTMTDASLSYSFDHNKYVIRGYIKNMENTPVNVYGETGGNHVYGILAPRTFGGNVTVNF